MTEPPNDKASAISTRLDLVDVLEAIATGSRDIDTLEQAVAAYRIVAKPLDEDDIAGCYIKILEALAHSVRWADAARQADNAAERHATACRLHAADALERANERWPSALLAAAKELATAADHAVAARAATLLASVPLPPRVTELFRPSNQRWNHFSGDDTSQESTHVALLMRLHGEPVMKPSILQPGALNHLEVEARVKEWPEGAEQLKVDFISVQDPSFLSAQSVCFTPDAMTRPLEIYVAGERPSGDPPLEITARAEFTDEDDHVPTHLIGNTTLQIVTFDPGTATPLNMPTAARQVLQMVHEMINALPNLSSADRQDVRLLLEGVLRFGHTVLDDRLGGSANINEAWFQHTLKIFLQADSQIGARLEEKKHLAGGETDLVLGNIVLELKLEKSQGITLDEACRRYAKQPTQYASAVDSQVSLLAVLDVSPKRAPAGVAGNEIGWAYPELASGPDPQLPSMVGVTVIRAGYHIPSAYSR